MRKSIKKICWNIEIWAVQKHVNIVDLVKSFPTNILLQNLASIQERPSPLKFADLAEKSEKGSISNLSTKVATMAEKTEQKIGEYEKMVEDVTVSLGNEFNA